MSDVDILNEQGDVYAYPRVVSITDTLPTMTEEELRQQFDDLLDEGDDVSVGGYTFTPSRVLKELDPIAYECELRNYADSLRDEYLIPGWND